jgi:hypothetical protein
MAGEWEYGSIRSVLSPVYPPLQAATHQARRSMPTPRAPHSQALTSGLRSYSSVSTGR